jgi:hypothetical protein
VSVIRPDTNATLISGRTDANGEYSLALPAGYTGPILVSISADATTTGMPVGMVLRSVDVVNTGETTHSTPVSFLSEMAAAMALSSTGDIKTAIKTARQQLEIGAMTGGVPVDLSANPATDTTVKALVDTIRVSAGDGASRTAFIAALSADLKDGSASSTQFKDILTNIGNSTNATLNALADDTKIAAVVIAINNGTAYTPTTLPVVADGVAAGITASKTMFRELRTQALALTDYQKSGTPGFFDKKALDVEAATRDVVGPDTQAIGYMIDAMNALDKNVMADTSIGASMDVITATKTTSGGNFSDVYGSQYNVTILGSKNWTFDSLLWMNDVPHSLTVTKTGAHSYSYTFTDANDTSKTYTGTFSWSGTALSVNGSIPTTQWKWTQDSSGNWTPNAIRTKMTANITGSMTTSMTTDSFSYAGTLKTYTGTALDTTITVNSAHYNLINVAATSTTAAKVVAEPLDFDGKFEMKTYTLTGKITASNYVDTDGHGKTIHIPKTVKFDGKASDSTDGSYISGSVTGTAISATLLSDWLYNVSFTGELNVPNRPLTKMILGYTDVDVNKANVSLTYQYDTTKITGTGVVAKHSTTLDGTNKYTATLKNQVGVTINVLGNKDGTISGSVLKDTTAIGTIDMLKTIPRVKYNDGTFETFL